MNSRIEYSCQFHKIPDWVFDNFVTRFWHLSHGIGLNCPSRYGEDYWSHTNGCILIGYLEQNYMSGVIVPGLSSQYFQIWGATFLISKLILQCREFWTWSRSLRNEQLRALPIPRHRFESFELFLGRLLVIERNWAAKHLTFYRNKKVRNFKKKNSLQSDSKHAWIVEGFSIEYRRVVTSG